MGDALKIAVIGGGAGGLVAAISAAEEARKLDLAVDIHIYEATDKIGRPILASGNGRCNFSNAHIEPSLYRNSDFAQKCLNDEFLKANHAQFANSPNGVVAWFANHGLMYTEEAEGRLYPRANKSSSVLDVLKLAIDILGVQVNLDSKVASIDAPNPSSKRLTMRMTDGSFVRADRIIVACGGSASADLLPEGAISFTKTTPVLCPIEVNGPDKKTCKKLENIRVKCALSIIRSGNVIAEEIGEAMFRKYGISGICAFNLSRFMREGDTLRVNLFPEMDIDGMIFNLENRKRSFENAFGRFPEAEELLRGMLLPRMAEVILERANVHLEKRCDSSDIAKIAKILLKSDFVVEGPADVEHAQVRRGGFDVDAVFPETMEIRAFPGVYIIGEALDVDGPCGGYNLTWAFATGLLAGRASTQSLSGSQSV